VVGSWRRFWTIQRAAAAALPFAWACSNNLARADAPAAFLPSSPVCIWFRITFGALKPTRLRYSTRAHTLPQHCRFSRTHHTPPYAVLPRVRGAVLALNLPDGALATAAEQTLAGFACGLVRPVRRRWRWFVRMSFVPRRCQPASLPAYLSPRRWRCLPVPLPRHRYPACCLSPFEGGLRFAPCAGGTAAFFPAPHSLYATFRQQQLTMPFWRSSLNGRCGPYGAACGSATPVIPLQRWLRQRRLRRH